MTLTVNRTLRLADGQYFSEPQKKTGIAIHHTVCRGARTAFESWQTDHTADGSVSHIATAYLIDHDGTVYEVFDPTAWAYQFGLTWADPARTTFEKRFVGIEIASEGPLLEQNGCLYAFDQISPDTRRPRDGAFDAGQAYRGYRWFSRYQPAQLTRLGQLVDELCHRFSITRVYPSSPLDCFGESLAHFEGVIGHAMVRPDKSDPAPDPRMWQALRELAAVAPTTMASSPASSQATPTGPARDAAANLFTSNMSRVNAMDAAAGSLVKDLLMELERQGTYLRLSTPPPGSHWIGYDVVSGDRTRVAPLAHALGFANVTDKLLEARHA